MVAWFCVSGAPQTDAAVRRKPVTVAQRSSSARTICAAGSVGSR